MRGSTGKFVWGRSYQNHQYTETSENDHVLGKTAHRKLRLCRCQSIVDGCLAKWQSCEVGEVVPVQASFAMSSSSLNTSNHSSSDSVSGTVKL